MENSYSNSLNIHQIHTKIASGKIIKRNFLFFINFGPKAHLAHVAHGHSRAAQQLVCGALPSSKAARGPARCEKMARRRAQAATWAWAGNPTPALFPPGPDLAQHGHRFISTIDYHPTDLVFRFIKTRWPPALLRKP
jgi:hypothetical protein